jgi:hypothetical protein
MASVCKMRVAKTILIIALTVAISGPCAGMEISRVADCAGGDVLRLRGDFKAGDYVKFRSYFADQRRVVGLDLDSPGGSLPEGFRIATLTRQKRLSTYVARECDSACAFVFLMGRKRYVSKEAKIGVHAVGNDDGSEDSGAIRDTIQFARLFATLGIPSSTIGKMVATPPRRITYLDQSDLASLKVIARDPFARDPSDGSVGCGRVSDKYASRAAPAAASTGRVGLARGGQ